MINRTNSKLKEARTVNHTYLIGVVSFSKKRVEFNQSIVFQINSFSEFSLLPVSKKRHKAFEKTIKN